MKKIMNQENPRCTVIMTFSAGQAVRITCVMDN